MSADQTSDSNLPVTGAGEGSSQPQETLPVPDAQPAAPLTEDAAVALLDSLVEPPKDEAPKSEAEPVKTEPTEPEKTDAESAVPELPKVKHPLDEDDDPDVEVDPKFTKIQHGFEKLRDKLRKARSDGAFGKTLVDIATREGISPQQLADLVQKNIRLAKGDPNATAEVAAELTKRGYRFASDTDAEVKAEADRIYKEQFAKGVEERHVDEDFARDRAKALATQLVQAKPKIEAPQPVPRTAPPAPALEQMAAEEFNTLDAQIAQSYKAAKLDYAPIKAEAEKRIREQANRTGGIPPQLWAYTYRQTVAQVQSEMLSKQRAATKPQIVAKNTLAPSTQVRKDDGSREAYMKSIADSI